MILDPTLIILLIESLDAETIIGILRNLQNSIESLSEGTISAQVLLLTAGVVIFLGIGGEVFFKRTGIPDIAFLMILGVIIGPVLGIVEPSTVTSVVPYFAALALIIIMFDGGLNLDLKSMAKIAHFSFILAIVGFVISVIIVAALAFFWLEWEILDSILLATIVGGSSSIIVFGLVRELKVSEDTKSVLSFESAMTDILSTIIAFILFGAILVGHFDPSTLGITIADSILIGLGLGLGVGIPWMFITSKLPNTKHAYMLTLGMLFVLFFLAQTFGESGALTALVFGLMLGNRERLFRLLHIKIPYISNDDTMHNQLTFLVRAFFFVFVGLLASFGNIEYIIFGIVATVGIYLGRLALTRVTLTGRFSKLDKRVTSVMIPRGLAAAVLATFPITLGLPNAHIYPQIVFVIILTSVILTTIGLSSAKKIPEKESDSGGFVKPDESKIKD